MAFKTFDGKPGVGIVMGSDSDLGVMKEAAAILKKFDVPFEITVASAHRSPARAAEFASTALARGVAAVEQEVGVDVSIARMEVAGDTQPVAVGNRANEAQNLGQP